MYRIHHQWLVNVCISNISITHTHSVGIAVPITGLLTGLITAIITSIIVYCIMRNKGNKQQQGAAAIYDLPIINKQQQQQQDIDTHTNTAYGHINY